MTSMMGIVLLLKVELSSSLNKRRDCFLVKQRSKDVEAGDGWNGRG